MAEEHFTTKIDRLISENQAALAQIEWLKATNEKLRNLIHGWEDNDIKIRAELAAAKRDAERLEYLLHCTVGEWEKFNDMRVRTSGGVALVVAAIDAARTPSAAQGVP